MSISSINSIGGNVLKEINGLSKSAIDLDSSNKTEDASKSFLDTIKDSIKNMQETQVDTDSKIANLVGGGGSDFADIIISAQKAEINMQLTLQIRNKLIEAYQEIMRTQV